MRPTDALFSLAVTLAAGALAPVAYMALRQVRERRRKADFAVRVGRIRESLVRADAVQARSELAALDSVRVDQMIEQLSSELVDEALAKG